MPSPHQSADRRLTDPGTEAGTLLEGEEPLLAMIVAMDRNRVIGVAGGLPWHLPDDMGWFRQVTMGKPVIMGRKTYASIPARFRPLPGRHNIVISRSQVYDAPGATVVQSPEAAVNAAGDVPEIIIAGGASIYRLFLPQTRRIYLTLVDASLRGDTFFPELDETVWQEVAGTEHDADARHAYGFRWLVLERSQPLPLTD